MFRPVTDKTKIKRPISAQPIPAQAKKVFDGKLFDIYQWPQKLFNGELATFEKVKRRDTVSVLPVTAQGKIVLARQSQPGDRSFVGCLGGRIDRQETPLQAAKRELLEEAGLEAKKWYLWRAGHLSQKTDWVIYNFIAKDLKKISAGSPDAGEKISLFEVDFDDLFRIAARKNFRDTELIVYFFRLSSRPREMAEVRRFFGK